MPGQLGAARGAVLQRQQHRRGAEAGQRIDDDDVERAARRQRDADPLARRQPLAGQPERGMVDGAVERPPVHHLARIDQRRRPGRLGRPARDAVGDVAGRQGHRDGASPFMKAAKASL
ncbi:MAG: hypothetical protein U1E53_22350 [Dongiaceae bacterium]